jgi:hypothetical protein
MALGPAAFSALVYVTLAALVVVFVYELYALVLEHGANG